MCLELNLGHHVDSWYSEVRLNKVGWCTEMHRVRNVLSVPQFVPVWWDDEDRPQARVRRVSPIRRTSVLTLQPRFLLH